jgi:transposase
VLYLATFVARTHNPVLRQVYQHLIAAGKARNVALVACAHTLLTILNALLRTRTACGIATLKWPHLGRF